ncbi:hypothetical protein F5883DRAFT_596989 [Diaporthe sp. PMI_573]|nr:hypothetical protein F5883DRAFT_596989 [Diaporthaceae sp. PMI_573]
MSAWDILYNWACLVTKGYEIDVVRFAMSRLDHEIDARYDGILDRDGSMAKAIAFVEGENIPLAQPVAKPRKERAARPKPGQHQARVLADRKADNKRLIEIQNSFIQTEKAAVLARVAVIIDECRVEAGSTELNWKALTDKFFQLAMASTDARSRAEWIHSGGQTWRNQHIAPKSEAQILFDRNLNSWWSNFLGLMGHPQAPATRER